MSRRKEPLKKSWVVALHKRFSALYGQKFTSQFVEDGAVDEWINTWSEGLAGKSGDDLRHALDRVSKRCEWPPSLFEFCQWVETAPKAPVVMLPAPSTNKSPAAEKCLAKIKEMMDNPRKDTRKWKQEVLDKAARGEKVTVAALNLARGL